MRASAKEQVGRPWEENEELQRERIRKDQEEKEVEQQQERSVQIGHGVIRYIEPSPKRRRQRGVRRQQRELNEIDELIDQQNHEEEKVDHEAVAKEEKAKFLKIIQEAERAKLQRMRDNRAAAKKEA